MGASCSRPYGGGAAALGCWPAPWVPLGGLAPPRRAAAAHARAPMAKTVHFRAVHYVDAPEHTSKM